MQNHWELLEISGNHGELMKFIGNHWKLLEFIEYYWNLLEINWIYEGSGKLLKIANNFK